MEFLPRQRRAPLCFTYGQRLTVAEPCFRCVTARWHVVFGSWGSVNVKESSFAGMLHGPRGAGRRVMESATNKRAWRLRSCRLSQSNPQPRSQTLGPSSTGPSRTWRQSIRHDASRRVAPPPVFNCVPSSACLAAVRAISMGSNKPWRAAGSHRNAFRDIGASGIPQRRRQLVHSNLWAKAWVAPFYGQRLCWCQSLGLAPFYGTSWCGQLL